MFKINKLRCYVLISYLILCSKKNQKKVHLIVNQIQEQMMTKNENEKKRRKKKSPKEKVERSMIQLMY